MVALSSERHIREYFKSRLRISSVQMTSCYLPITLSVSTAQRPVAGVVLPVDLSNVLLTGSLEDIVKRNVTPGNSF
jgi:hypothetical protein